MRPEWSYQVRTICQEFHNRAIHADREGFEAAACWLRSSTPAPLSVQEGDWLKGLLKDAIVSSGIAFHRRHHAQTRDTTCDESPVEAAHHLWAHYDDDPRTTLGRWIDGFLDAFDRAHPPSLARRAATILRSRFRNPPGLDELSALLAASRSTLAREFKAEFGITCREYAARVRLRYFVSQARNRSISLGLLAEECGYRSYHNLVDAVKQRTGITPRALHALAPDQIEQLLHGAMSVGAGWVSDIPT